MKRRQCSGRNAKDTGPCQATASEGFETCARCGDRRKPRGFPSMEKRRASQADIARRPPTNSLGEPWVEGQTWTCTGCGATGPDRDDVRMPASCECVAPMRYAPAEHEAAMQAWRAARSLDADIAEFEATGTIAMKPQREVVVPHPSDVGVVDAARLVLSERGCDAYHADWRALAEVARAAGGVDALIVDAPYSERTHAGHDGGAAQANGSDDRWTRSNGRVEAKRQRRDLDYGAWTQADADAFVDTWHPLVRGWIVSLTDDGLFGHWRAAMARVGRQTFQDVPCVVRGMSVRLVGDGPSSWAVHAAVGRPRTKAMAQWGTLDGAYEGPSERQAVVGGKPTWLMRALVRDYTRHGDLVADPCAGAFTTGVACIAEGRRFLGGDRDEAHVALGVERLRALPAEPKRGTLALPWAKGEAQRRVPVAANG